MFLAALLLACPAEVADSATAGPAAPEVYLLSPAEGANFDPGVPVQLTGVLVDDGTPPTELTIRLHSTVDGDLPSPTVTDDGQLDSSLSVSEGAHTLTLTAADAAGHAAERTVHFTVVPADRPSQPAVAITPSAPVTGDALLATLVVPAVDPEGAPLTYTWSWTVDGEGTDLAGDNVPAERLTAGATWEVAVVADNGTTQAPSAVARVTVGNAPPTVGSVRLGPDPADTTTPLLCEADPASDPEQDPFTEAWAWEIDGAAQGHAEATLPAGVAQRGDRVRCGKVLTDAWGNGTTTWSEPLVLGNLAPTVAAVVIDPAEGDVTTPFTCRAHGLADPDRDVVQVAYTWTLDGVEAGTGPGLAAGIPRDTVVGCTAVPSDGVTAGAPVASAPVVVGNTPPGAPGVVALGDVAAGSPASCALDRLPTDADGDVVEITWTWEVDEAVLPADGPTVATTGLPPGAVLRCTATPDDGRALGPSDADTLTLGAPTRGDVAPGAAWVAIEGTVEGGRFGKVVDDVPDLDGDGLAELIVGAPGGDGGTRGAVHLFTSATLGGGGAFLDTDADATWFGAADGDQLGSGRGAAGVGDADGDQVGDVLVAAPGADAAATDGGVAWLLSGARAGGSDAVDVGSAAITRFEGEAGDMLGVRLAGGDLDGDGVADVALGAPYRDTAGDRAGSVLVWFGGAGLGGLALGADQADAEITGRAAGDQLGWSVAVAPDGDGDGYAELLTGAFQDDTRAVDAGAAVAVSGDTLDGVERFDTAGWLVALGEETGEHLGYEAAGAGDLDGDGLGDLVFGAYLADPGGADSGRIVVFYGRAGLNRVVDAGDADLGIVGTRAGDRLGSALDGAGDFDGDGAADLILGAGAADTDAGEVGLAWLFLGAGATRGGSLLAVDTLPARFVGDAPGALLGDEVAGGFDLDGNGFSEVALGSQGDDGGAPDAGAVQVHAGP